MCIGAKLSETGKIYLNPFNSNRAFLWIMMVINLSNMRKPIFIDGIVGEIILLILFLGTLFGYAYLNQGIKKYIYLLFVYPILNIVFTLISKEEMIIVLLSFVINILTMYSAALYYKKLENIESEKI